MSIFCTATGLEAIAKPEWIFQKVSNSFEANFFLISDSIIYSRPKGYADLPGVKKSIGILDNVIETAARDNKPYIQIEDYSLITGSAIDARKYFADKANEDRRRKAMIFCNTSLPLSIAVKLYSRFVSAHLDIQVVKSYKDAIVLALKLLKIEKMDLDSDTFDICSNLNKDESSFDPVEIVTEKFLNIQSQDYSCPSFIIDKHILYSTSTGHFREEHIPLIGQMITDCHKAIEDISIQYNIVDCKDFKGIYPNTRIKHMAAMKKWHQQFPLRMLIMYGVNAPMKTAVFIANTLMPFKVRVAENIQHAFQIINEDKKSIEITDTKKEQERLPVTQDDIEKLVIRIRNLHWDGKFKNSKDMYNLDNTAHPLYPIYTSVNLMKEEIDELFQELKHADQEKEKLIIELKQALKEIKTLSGLIPLCSMCKKIRDDKGYWNQLEFYIEKYSDATFSHSMCPECSDELYGKENWYLKMKKK